MKRRLKIESENAFGRSCVSMRYELAKFIFMSRIRGFNPTKMIERVKKGPQNLQLKAKSEKSIVIRDNGWFITCWILIKLFLSLYKNFRQSRLGRIFKESLYSSKSFSQRTYKTVA